jgi:hypothetical protein
MGFADEAAVVAAGAESHRRCFESFARLDYLGWVVTLI